MFSAEDEAKTIDSLIILEIFGVLYQQCIFCGYFGKNNSTKESNWEQMMQDEHRQVQVTQGIRKESSKEKLEILYWSQSILTSHLLRSLYCFGISAHSCNF